MLRARLFKERGAVTSGRALYAAAVAQARRPTFYLAGAPDTPEGRFELYTLHTVLLLHRLKGEGSEAAEVSQATFDAFIRGLDDGLRDMGVGDLSVGKKMRRLGEAFYGRVKSYDAALAERPDDQPLCKLLMRTVLDGGDAQAAPALAAYVGQSVDRLAAKSLRDLCAGQVDWPEFVG